MDDSLDARSPGELAGRPVTPITAPGPRPMKHGRGVRRQGPFGSRRTTAGVGSTATKASSAASLGRLRIEKRRKIAAMLVSGAATDRHKILIGEREGEMQPSANQPEDTPGQKAAEMGKDRRTSENPAMRAAMGESPPPSGPLVRPRHETGSACTLSFCQRRPSTFWSQPARR